MLQFKEITCNIVLEQKSILEEQFLVFFLEW